MINSATKLNFSSMTRNKRNIDIFKISTIILGGLMIVSVATIMFFNTKMNSLQNELYQVKEDYSQQAIVSKVAKLENENQSLKTAYNIQKTKYKTFEKLIKDLERCKKPKEALAIGYSESTLRYDIKHPTSDLSGIGGFKMAYWKDYLNKLNIKPNSLHAIDAIYVQYLATGKNHDEALKSYKGTVNNFKSYYITKRLIARISTSDVKRVINLQKNVKALEREIF